MIVEKDLKALSKEQLITVLRSLINNPLKVRAYQAQQKQLENIIKYLEDNNIVDNIDDKEDKKFDRLKSFAFTLDDMVLKLEKSEDVLVKLKNESNITETEDNSVIAINEEFNRYGRGKNN